MEAEEISTLFGAKVKVYPNGEIKVIKDGEEDENPKKRKRRRFSRKMTVPKKKVRTAKSVVNAAKATRVKTQKKATKTKK